MKYAIKLALFSTFFCCVSACQLNTQPQVTATEPTFTTQQKQHAEQRARALIAKFSLNEQDNSPMLQAYRGLKTNYDQWDDISEQAANKHHQQNQAFLADAESIQLDALDDELRINVELLIYELKQSISGFVFRHHNYPVNQLFGLHTEIPNFLVNTHEISSIQDANAYIARINGIRPFIKQLIEQLEVRKNKGIIAPAFVYEAAIKQCRSMTQGMPFDNTEDNVLLADFKQKIDELALYESSKAALIKRINKALKRNVYPAYKDLAKYLTSLKQLANQENGFHQFENGLSFYDGRLQEITTTTLSAEQIHNIGIEQVERIQQDIHLLLPQLKINSIDELFARTRNDATLYFDSLQQAANESRRYIKQVNKQLNLGFSNIPNIPMELTALDASLSDEPLSLFYQAGQTSRLYLQESLLTNTPTYQLEALTYRESIPGKHLQHIYAMQNKSQASFRRYAYFSAYNEGWGLYAETIAKELGGFQDPWNEYGRLLLDLWRSSQLVIDTGLHAKGWNIDQALAFQTNNTPFHDEYSKETLQQYLVMPGQSTASKIGELQFLSLRDNAKKQLGQKFDLGTFHAYMLTLGPLPFTVLETQINRWIKQQQNS